MVGLLFKEIKFRFFYFFSGILFNFFIIYLNRTQFFYFIIKPLYFSFSIFNWSFSYASPFESFSIFLFFCTALSFFFSYPNLLIQVFLYVLPGINIKKQIIFLFIVLFSFSFYVFSFFFCFNSFLPNIFMFCFEQNISNTFFSLAFFPIVSPYFLFILKIMYSLFLFFQIPLFFFLFLINKEIQVGFLIKNRKHFFIFSLFFGTLFSTPDVLSQLLFTFVLILSFEIILFFVFIRFFLV